MPLAVISDPGQDQDDEMAMILLRALVEQGLVNCLGIVANLGPARARARSSHLMSTYETARMMLV